MDSLNILITGAGAPGIKGSIYSLKNNYDKRKVMIYGTDVKDNVVGKYLCDHFYTISHSSKSQNYINDLIDISNKNNIDIIIPQNTLELELLSRNQKVFQSINTKVIISNNQSIINSNNKLLLMKKCEELNIPVGKYYIVNNKNSLINKAKLLKWPENKLVVKPPLSNGSRGVRIVDEKTDLKNLFYNEKPSSMYTNLDMLVKVLGEEFPDLIITEYLPGFEYTVDVFKGESMYIIPRKRYSIKSGISFDSVLEKSSKIISFSKKLSNNLQLEYCFGFQFKMDENNIPKIIECNPRVQGTMVMSTMAGANIIYSSVKHAIGEKVPNLNINWDTRFTRYWGGVSINKKEIKII
tara:strand:+ start:215 stop:1270 length:1056 start_codon:yes stop_codon:yes gene_type:complete